MVTKNKLFVKTTREHSSIIPLIAARCKDKMIVRVSGGCGYMNKDQEKHMMSFVEAFEQMRITVIGGGTRMLYKEDLSKVRPGITEWLPAIKAIAPESQTIGIVPRIEGDDMGFLPNGQVAFDNGTDEYVTTFMHQNDISLLIQEDVDTGARYDDEYIMALRTMKVIQDTLGHRLLTIFYNGGDVSEKEMLQTVKLGWDVVLIAGSGRMCDKYAQDKTFLQSNPNVHIITTPTELKKILHNHS